MVYNNLDKIVATQDANQRATNSWTFTKYDALGRTIQSGTWNAGSAISQSSLQSSVNGVTTLWETATGSGIGYSNSAWPTSSTTNLTLNYYDNYSFPGNPYGPWNTSATTPKGLLTATKTAVLNTPGEMLWAVHYYDDYGRNIQTTQQHYLGGTLNYSTYNYDVILNTYNFNDQPISVQRFHFTAAAHDVLAFRIDNAYSYDHMGRKTKTYTAINGATSILLSQIDYNEIGQARTKHLHSTNSGSSFQQDVTYAYNERGWLTQSTAPLFAMQLKYNDGTTPQYNGNIANQYWGTPGNLNKSYTYSYDYLNRLTAGTSSEGYTENNIGYDELGNILHLNRQSSAYTYNYTNGNQLSSVTGLTSGNYTYDANGNMSYDARNGNNISYNILNLPQSITGSKTITYTYDAAGNKLRRVSTGTGSTDYISGIQYDGSVISYIQTEEGRAIPSGGSYNYEYSLADHLGNTRLSFDSHTGTATTVQQDDYYPFGMEINRSVTSPKNEYLYNKKELQEELGQYDYGARFYDPVIGRWTTVDPLAEISRKWSPYNYVMNNPIRLIDPDGMSSTDVYGRDKFDANGIFKLPDERGATDFGVIDQQNQEKRDQTQNPNHTTTSDREPDETGQPADMKPAYKGSHYNKDGALIYFDGVLKNYYGDNGNDDYAIFTDKKGNKVKFGGVHFSPFNGSYIFPLGFDKSSGSTFPNGSIFLGTEGNGLADLEHEYGHYLDAKIIGALKYILTVGISSPLTANSNNHLSESYEIRATRLAIQFFGPKSAIATAPFYPH
jgi:RHS repeat-associated protein